MKQAESLVAESLLVLHQIVECSTVNETKHVDTNPMTAKSFGMMPTQEDAAKKKFDLQRIVSRSRRKLVDGDLKNDATNKVQ